MPLGFAPTWEIDLEYALAPFVYTLYTPRSLLLAVQLSFILFWLFG